MKNKIKVIRREHETIVVYREPTKAKPTPQEMLQKAILVRELGKRLYYVMPNGTILPIRHGAFWKFIKLIRPSSRFAV